MNLLDLLKQYCFVPLGALVALVLVVLLAVGVYLYARGYRLHIWHNGEDDGPDES